MVNGSRDLLCWASMSVEEVVCLFCNLFCSKSLHFFSHDFSYARRDGFEDVLFEDVVDFHILDVILEAQEIL